MAVVLVAEDDEAVRVLAQSVIEGMGHIGLTAANAEEALALLSADREVSLLFTDLNMASNPLAGIELAVQARANRPEITVIYTSAAGVTDGTRALFVEGASFLPKPYTVDQLQGAVEAELKTPTVRQDKTAPP
jgi:CheY-like chemotaxis protein